MKRRTKSSSPELSKPDAALWRRVGAGLSEDIFDRFEDFGTALGAALDGFTADELRTLERLIPELSREAPGAWEISGAGIGFGGPRDARMALMMLLEAVKSRL